MRWTWEPIAFDESMPAIHRYAYPGSSLERGEFRPSAGILSSLLATARFKGIMHPMSRLHKVFVSYHHELDESRRKILELRYGNRFDVIIPGSVQIGDIDETLSTETIRQKIRNEYLRDTSVTVVLVGALTWQRKHVDWEIGSSIRDTASSPRSGLFGILLPSYFECGHNGL